MTRTGWAPFEYWIFLVLVLDIEFFCCHCVAFVCQCTNYYHDKLSNQGVLGKLGSPGKVLGVDISEDMIGHCSSHYNGQDNLSFEVQQENNVFWTQLSPKTLDVSNGADFCKTRGSSFDMASRAFDNLTWQVKLKSLISWCLFVGWETILQIDVVFVSTLYTGCCLLLLCCFSSIFCVVWTIVILCWFCY